MYGYRSKAPNSHRGEAVACAHAKLPALPIILRMATDLAAALGVTIPNHKYLRKMISRRISIPQLYRNNNFILWIDRYYIALQALSGKQPVLYAYLSRAHIAEELADDLQARRRGSEALLDAPTRAQFAAALRAMKASRLGYAMRELKPTSGRQQPLNLRDRWLEHPLALPMDEENHPRLAARAAL